MYAVIEFIKDIPKTIAVIPTNWFVDEQRNYCFWPPNRDVTALVKSKAAVVVGPKNGWQKHGVRQIGKYDTADYDEACRWCRRADVTLNLKSGLEKLKRTRKSTRKVSDSESESESDSDDDTDTPHRSNKRTKKAKNKKAQQRRLKSSPATSNLTLPQVDTKSDTECAEFLSLLTPYPTSTPQPVPSVSTSTYTTMNYSGAVDVGLQSAIDMVNHSSTFLDNNIQRVVTSTENLVPSTRIEQLLTALTRSVDELKRGQRDILHAVQELRRTQGLHSRQLQTKNESENGADTADAVVDQPQLPWLKIPFESLEELTAAEEMLSNPAVADDLVRTLASIGGMNLRQTVQRLMERLMVYNVECLFSLVRPPKGKTALKSMKLYDIIVRAVRFSKHPEYATEAEIDYQLSKYLIGTRDRNGKRQQRRRLAARAADASADESADASANACAEVSVGAAVAARTVSAVMVAHDM